MLGGKDSEMHCALLGACERTHAARDGSIFDDLVNKRVVWAGITCNLFVLILIVC
jgi:hypothetical protein